MSLRQRFQRLFHKSPSRSLADQVRRPPLHVEALETRLMPYSVSGYAWPHPELVTLSFVPDGTNLGGAASNLFATFNAKFGSTAAWQNQILKAAQVWAQQTNLNFSVVSDNGADIGSGANQQGDPGFGDIRIGGFNFGCSTLAMAYMPPSVNNYSVAGDISFNTAQAFNIGTTYDLFTVATHEIGHALGLLHSDVRGAVLYPTYTVKMSGLSSDDIAGIRAIYSPNSGRTADGYSAATVNNSFAAAAEISGQITPGSETAQLNNLDITTAGQSEYFKFTAPAGSSSTLTVNVQSSGLSLLAPTLTVYNANQATLATVSGAGHYGTTLRVTINGVTAGSTYYVKVAGADSSAFGTGRYALTVNLGTAASPTVSSPNTATPNGNPPSGGGGQAFNPSVVQQASGGGLVGGLFGLVGGVVQDVLGLLHDAAGAFDLLDAPGTNAFVHSPGCCCPGCRQAASAQDAAIVAQSSLTFQPPAPFTLFSQTSSNDHQVPAGQPTLLPTGNAASSAGLWQAPDEGALFGLSLAGLGNGQANAQSWAQDSEAFFADAG